MKFNIFFDESHQLDKHSSIYCYYGILGYEQEKISQLNKLFQEKNIKHEIHFSKFKLNQLDNYLEVLKFALNNSRANIYMVHCEEALSLGAKIELDAENIRKLFYLKLPERLIYGMTRKLPGVKDINITIDKSDAYGNNNLELLDDKCKNNMKVVLEDECDSEGKLIKIKTIVEEKYKHIQLAKSLKEQLNSHSLYRNLNYKINKIKQENSEENVGLQSIDVLLGVVAYLFEEKYLNIPEDFQKATLESKLEFIKLTPLEEQLLFQTYELKGDKYFIKNKVINNKLVKQLRNLNKKLMLTSSKDIQKVEFIYRILSDNEMLEMLYEKDMFRWSLDNKDISKNVNRIYISKYISKFLNYKMQYDNSNIKVFIKKYIEDTASGKELNKSEYAKCINLNINNTWPLIDRYLEILDIKI